MEQVSDEELDHGAEEDSDKEDQDLDKMFGAWLGELDKLTQSLDDGRPQKPVQKPPLRQETNMANFSYRFSMYNINEALNQGDTVDLDALMADLCSIEQELSTISKPNSSSRGHGRGSTNSSTRASPANTVRGTSSGGHSRPTAANISLADITSQLEKASLSMDEAARQTAQRRPSSGSTSSGQHRRTGSVGAVSEQEAPSQRSSVNSACASASSMDSLDIDKVTTGREVEDVVSVHAPLPAPQHVTLRRARRQLDFTPREGETDRATHSYLDRETSLILKSIAGKPTHLLTKEEQAAKLKAERIRVALEKIKEAQVKKLVIRVHMSDESSKTMMVDERQTVRQVLDSLLDKSHCGYSPDWSLVETITELQMERIFEDHENLVENLLNWTRDSHNKLMFTERIEKYALFKNPQNYLLGRKETSEMADRNKEALLEECFCGGSVSVPEIEGILWLKEDGKKSWKKRYFLLRASGIYYVPKGKAKASRDLVCFLQLDHVNVYYGQDYRSKYKAPTDYCLALKHPQIQKKSQYIKYLCCDDVRTLHQWVNGIRIAKYGKQLYGNYQEAMKRTEAAYDWSSLSTSSIRSGSSSASIPESQSNHSGHSDSGVDTTSSQGRSQSVVSSIFSEAWKRGTQIEENTKIIRPQRRLPSTRCRPSLRPRLSNSTPVIQQQPLQAPPQLQRHHPPQPSQPPPAPQPEQYPLPPQPEPLHAPPAPHLLQQQQLTTAQTVSHHSLAATMYKYSTITRLQNQKAGTHKPNHVLTKPVQPPAPPAAQMPTPGSAMAVLRLGPPSPAAPPAFIPPPPTSAHALQPVPMSQAVHCSGLKQALKERFPSPPRDLLCLNGGLEEQQQFQLPSQFPPPPPTGLAPHTAPKPVSPVSPFPPAPPPAALGQPPPTLPKQHSLPKQGPSSTGGHQAMSLVKQLASQFPGASCPVSQSDLPKAPLSPPAVKTKPRWQPGGGQQLQSPEFPPPPADTSAAFIAAPPPPPPPAPVTGPTPPPAPVTGPTPPAPPLPPGSLGSPTKKPPSSSLNAGGKRPPPTPQRNSSVKAGSSGFYEESRRNLLSKFAPPSACPSPSPSKEASNGPPAPPKPGKLNLGNLPAALQAKVTQAKRSGGDFPSPPPECACFPPPPPASELFPPAGSEAHNRGAPKVAVVNPQPQASPWGKSSLKKTPPPTLGRRSNATPEPPPLSPPPATSPKGGSGQPNFLEDLSRTLRRKSVGRQGSLNSSTPDPAGTMDDALPPPPPELLSDHARQSNGANGGYVSGNISGYATLRRGPPPAPPKRGDATKLTGEC
uniref:Ras association (RalGDS/AF-6) and pleckstrin homology domains 1b n=1 Tax=Tetraodon nigroviridis TaxID=99883 RepID=H3DAK8_TETNG